MRFSRRRHDGRRQLQQVPYPPRGIRQNVASYRLHRFTTQEVQYNPESEHFQYSPSRGNYHQARYNQQSWSGASNSLSYFKQPLRRANNGAAGQFYPDIDPDRPDQRGNHRNIEIELNYDSTPSITLSRSFPSARLTDFSQPTQQNKPISPQDLTQIQTTIEYNALKSISVLHTPKATTTMKEDADWMPEKEMPLWIDLCKRRNETLRRAGLDEHDEKTERYYEYWLEDHTKRVKDLGTTHYSLYKRIDLLKGTSCIKTRGNGFFELITEDEKYKDREDERPQKLLDRIAEQQLVIGQLRYEAIHKAILEEALRAAPW